jgi:hypothetical protein
MIRVRAASRSPAAEATTSSARGSEASRYLEKMSRAAAASGRSILIFTSRRPGPQDRRVDHVLAVGGADHDHVLELLDPVDLAQQLGHDGVLDVGGHPRPAGAEDRVHLVEEHDHRHALEDFSLARWKISRIWRSVSPRTC